MIEACIQKSADFSRSLGMGKGSSERITSHTATAEIAVEKIAIAAQRYTKRQEM